MNLLLIVRPEILSIFIIIFLIFYDVYCSKYREGKDYFIGFAIVCLGHDIMALVTEITVNLEAVPVFVNNICHILFFLFSLLYSLEYFQYALSLVMPKSQMKKVMIIGYVPSILAIIVMLVSPIHYLQGNGTIYSAGTGPTLCYALGFLLFITSDIILIVKHKRISDTIMYTLLPLSILALGLLLTQILVPEFLFTGSALTLTSVGVFLAVENPVGKFRDRAFIDHNTQTWNRNCYEYDLENVISSKVEEGERLSCVIVDINGLKNVNDSMGHLYGDKLIESVATTLHETMTNAFRIYRIGGDEFAIIYLGKSSEMIKREIALASETCGALRLDGNIPVGASFGFAEQMDGEAVPEIIHRADIDMYFQKEKYYKQKGIDRRKSVTNE